MYLTAAVATIAAWFVGLVLDANIDFGEPCVLCLRTLFPILVMGLFLLRAIHQKKDQ